MLPEDLTLFRTGDGSFTLKSQERSIFYHSVVGAVQESTHVFIKAGLEHVQKASIDVLEVGLGTGLNMLLTYIRCLEGKCNVRYTALEPQPVPMPLIEQLGYCDDLGWPGLAEPYHALLASEDGVWSEAPDGFAFRQFRCTLDQYSERERYDVIYYDAFAPAYQPELWTATTFVQLLELLRPGGHLVTYCAKGNVRRAMMEAGFTVERLPGPPRKREMLRAQRPL